MFDDRTTDGVASVALVLSTSGFMVVVVVVVLVTLHEFGQRLLLDVELR